MKKSVAIIVGGTGQFGLILAKKLLQKKYKVIITTRSLNKAKKKIKNNNNLKINKLDIFNKKSIEKLLLKFKPKFIFYFAGQSSLTKSKKLKNETNNSNFVGAKNFLITIKIP